MHLLNSLNKPEYFCQPKFILKKLFGKQTPNDCISTLSWGDKISIKRQENIGKSIFDMGVYDLSVTEAIYRLCEPGDHIIDAGANIGYTSLLALYRIGKTGKLDSFEPHPYIFKKLLANLELNNYKNFELHQVGLSEKEGKTNLVIPKYFTENEGISYIGDKVTGNDFENLEIDIKTLDCLFSDSQSFKLLKIDVEGHELKVFIGAKNLLFSKKIENILFECNHDNHEIITYLTKFGYDVFRLDKTLFKLKLSLPNSVNNNPQWEPINYIATLNTKKILAIFGPSGYKSLT